MQLASVQRSSHAGMEGILSAEREWFSSRIQSGLEKTQRLLLELGMRDSADVLKDNGEDFARRGSLDFVSQELDETSRKIFRSMFTHGEWIELAAVDAALLRGDAGTLERLREERLGFFLRSARTLLLVGPVAGGGLVQEMNDLVSVLNNAVSKSAVVATPVESESLDQDEEREEAPQPSKKRQRKPTLASVVEVQEEVTRKPKRSRQALISRAIQEDEEEEPIEKEQEKEQEKPGTSDSSEQEEIEKQLEDEDEEEEVVTVEILLEQMRSDQDLVLNLLKLSGKKCSVKAFGIPNLAAISPKLGEELVADASKLASCLQHHDQLQVMDCAEQIEQLGRLLGWWRLVERCIHIMSILDCLREKQKTTVRNGRGKRGQKVPLNDLFAQLVGEVESQGWKCMKLRQALCYDQLGKFLQQHPKFLFQLQVVTLQDWRFWLKKEVGLVSKLDDAWKDMPAVVAVDAEDEDDGVVCVICQKRRKDGDRKLWSCDECESMFHEQCAQYTKKSLCESVLLPVMGGKEDEFPLKAYCPRCLDTLQHSQRDVEQAVVEAKTIRSFLKDAECPFFLKRAPPDGACIFHILYEFQQEVDGVRGGRNNLGLNDFCGEVAKAALTTDEARSCSAEDRQALQKLVQARKKVELLTKQNHWHEVNVQLILFGYVSLLEDVQVKLFQASNGRVFCGEASGSYGNGQRVLKVLQWNSAFYRHYDRLVPK